jgi:hypothetical protein
MKKIFLLLSACALFFISCSKENTSAAAPDDMASTTFEAMQETNVSHYIIQTSADGRQWRESAVILTDDQGGNKTYTANFSISQYRGKFYTQIVAVDKDGRESYSAVKITNF